MINLKDCVVSTRVRLARNFVDLPFPHKLKSANSLSMIVDNIKPILEAKYKARFIELSKMKAEDKLVLIEKHIISPELASNPLSGLYYIEDENISIMLNEEDHIREQVFADGYDLFGCYEKINKLDDEFCKNLKLAYSEKYGFLTACPSNLGTGMRASVMMFLPALTKTGKIESIINAVKKLGIVVRGMYGEGSKSIGYLYQISNKTSLGYSEKEILERVDSIVKKIAFEEEKTAETLLNIYGIYLKDSIMRSLGLLKYAEIITLDESIEAISQIKLGILLKLINMPMEKINKLIDEIQKGHIMIKAKDSAENHDIERAKIIKNFFIESK